MIDATTRAVINSAIDGIENQIGYNIAPEDLHNVLFNENYFVVGYREAEKLLDEYGTFNAIREIKEYEQDMFGEVTTDLSDSEKVMNMLAYIIGQHCLDEVLTSATHSTKLFLITNRRSLMSNLNKYKQN